MATVHVLSRRLAGTQLGAKNRKYRSLPSARPTIEQWTSCLGRPGDAGGLGALPASLPSFLSPSAGDLPEKLEKENPTDQRQGDANDQKMAEEDVKATAVAKIRTAMVPAGRIMVYYRLALEGHSRQT